MIGRGGDTRRTVRFGMGSNSLEGGRTYEKVSVADDDADHF